MDPMQVKGNQEFIRKLNLADKKIFAAATRGLEKAGLHVFKKAQSIIPVWQGNLKASGKVEQSPDKKSVVINYTSPYAVYVHEITTNVHGHMFNVKYAKEIAREKDRTRRRASKRKTDPYYKERGENQQAKFLATPLNRERSEMLNIIANEIKRVR